MQAVLSTVGTFHLFDLARELHAQGCLAGIHSGYPAFKLKGEKIPHALVHTFPWVHAPYMAFRQRGRLGSRMVRGWERLDRTLFDRHVAAALTEGEVLVGMSGSCLRSGRVAHARGMSFVCDRGSSHIRVQDRLLREEHDRWGWHFQGVDPWIIEREEAEYAQADCITVPSGFNVRTFLAQGVPADKVRQLPYGVNLDRFHPTHRPVEGRFDVLFAGGMSLRKGVPYLLEAYRGLSHPRKSLTFVGTVSAPLVHFMRQRGWWSEDIRLLGHVDQLSLKHVMSRSHVMVLPSIEEGLALVQAQAMACGCPVIATENTGSQDLFDHGQEGFIVPIRRSDLITHHLQMLADDPTLRDEMGQRSLARVRRLGGWQRYGTQARAIYEGLRS